MNKKISEMRKGDGLANRNFQYIRELNTAYFRKQLIIFYGAGLSMPLGLPNWKKLIDYVVSQVIEDPSERKKCKKEIEESDSWEAMEYIKKYADVTDEEIKLLIADCIKSSQDNSMGDLSEIDNNYSDLMDSNVAFFITTNYDTLLEKVDNRCEISVISDVKDKSWAEICNVGEGKKRIIYLHGCVNDPSSIVITKETVEEIYQSDSWKTIFQNFLNRFHILFIGVSFEDKYLTKFLDENVKNNNNRYYAISDKKVGFNCKNIIIPKDSNQIIQNIRMVLHKIKLKTEETIWIRIQMDESVMDDFQEAIEKLLCKEEDIEYEINLKKQKNYVIIAANNMKKSSTVEEAIGRYKNILNSRTVKKYISNSISNVVYFYSSNTENFSVIDYKKVFKNDILYLLVEQVLGTSKGYIIDRIGMEPNEENSKMFEKLRPIRCKLKPDVRGNKSPKEYIFYIDEKVSIRDAKAYGVEVHVSGFCFFDDRVLMENRSEKMAIASDMIAPIGGRMRAEENFIQALERHFRDDCNLTIDNIKVCNVFTTFNANIPGVAFVCDNKGIFKKSAKAKVQYGLYTKEQLLKICDEDKLACTRALLLEAFEQKQKIRKKSIKLRMVLWSACCYNCRGCHHENLGSTEIVYNGEAMIKNLLKLGEIFDIRQITITGGEPMQGIQQLEKLLKEVAVNFPMTDIAIITNAENLNGKLIDKFRQYGVRYKISLYGYDNKSFEEYTGYKGYTNEDYLLSFKNKLKILNDKKIQYTVNIPVHRFILSGLKRLFDDETMLELLLEHNSPVKIIDMVKPRNEESNEFKDIYIPIKEAEQYLMNNEEINCSGDYERLKENMNFFVYPCKSCNGDDEDCLEKFALTLEPDGKLLVCENAIKKIRFKEQNFIEFMASQGIVVETTEYNKEYGKI